ncbi:MAG: type IV pilus modification PilV family protein [Burkholderiaceae bacterium]
MLLLEGMIAILIFSLGILGLVGMQAIAIKQVSDAEYRSQASLLANQLLGQMWADNRNATVLKATYDSGTAPTAYTTWQTAVAAALPGTTLNNNQPTVNVDTSGGSTTGTVTITIKWQAPSDTTAHQYITVAQII